MLLRNGVWEEAEAEADRIIFGHLKAISRAEAKKDVLTPWKEYNRRTHEVMMVGTRKDEQDPPGRHDVVGGVPDRAVRSGMFDRSVNSLHPWLNSMPNGWHSSGATNRISWSGTGRYGEVLHTPNALPWLHKKGGLTPEYLIFPVTIR